MTYPYLCKNCNHKWEEDQRITAEPLTKCPKCEQETAQRQISGGTGFVCKGSGWFNSGGY